MLHIGTTNAEAFHTSKKVTSDAKDQHCLRAMPALREVLELEFDNGQNWRVHPLLLRERCGPRQNTTKQRLFEIIDVIGGCSVQGCHLADEGQSLHLEFADGQQGTFDVASLLDERKNESNLIPDVRLWDPSCFRRDAICFDGAHLDDGELAEQLLTQGIAIVRNVKTEIGCGYDWLTHHLGVVRATEWGSTFHVKVEQKTTGRLTEDVAYTNEAIDLHVDNPYRRPVPGYWCLHALSMGHGGGGETLVCDGFTVSERLRTEDPAAFEILTKVPISFRYTDGQTIDLNDQRPHIQLALDPKSGRKQVRRITYSGRLDEVPLDLSPEDAQEYYRARKVWLEMARQNAIQFKLNDGEMIILNNERVMHGRTQIHGSHGDKCTGRFLEGCYIDKDGVTSRYFLRKSADRTKAVSVRPRLVSARMTLVNQKTSGEETEISHAKVTFRSLDECSQRDIKHMTDHYARACSAEKLAQRAIAMLQSADNAQMFGCLVSLREHCLQSASRALADGASDEVVVAALLHDVGELLSPSNHGEIPASMLAPYISPKTHWVLAHHEIFQMYYYAHHLGMDRNTRDQYTNHPYFEACRKFCEDYDAPSFDPDYPTMPLEQFVPILHRVFSLEAYWWDHSHPKRNTVLPSQALLSKL